MHRRRKWSIFSIAALLLGALDYMLYRQSTYIGALSFLPAMPWHRGYNFFAYYFPDFLWAFSLTFGLFAVLAPNQKHTFPCGIIAVTYGIVWEAGQHFGFLSGTADLVDLFMYIAAAVAAVIIKYSVLRRD